MRVSFLDADVRRYGRVGCKEAEGTGGREREAEEASDGICDGRVYAERYARKKLLASGATRNAVDWAITHKG